MGFDFSNIRTMANQEPKRAAPAAAQAAPTGTPLEWDGFIFEDPPTEEKNKVEPRNGNASQTQKNSPKTNEMAKVDQKDVETNSRAYNVLQSEQRERERMQQVYRTYQDNPKKSELAQARLLKGMKAGDDCETLLFIAVECIAHMTNNHLFMDQFVAAAADRAKARGGI